MHESQSKGVKSWIRYVDDLFVIIEKKDKAAEV